MLAPSNRPKSRLRRTLSARAKSKGQRAKRLALTSLVLVPCTLLFALSAVALGGFALVRTRAATPDSSPFALSPSPSLAWLSDRAWLHPSRVGSSPFCLSSLPLFAPTLSSPVPFAVAYTWNVAGSGAFSTASNWTPSRSSPASDDILVFNNGATITASNVTTQTIGQVSIGGGTNVTLQAGLATQTLTINGGAGSLAVANGSQLNISGDNVLTISVAAGSTGSISGSMIFSGATVNTGHQLLAASASGITFNSGSSFTQGLLNSENVFGSGTSNSVVFASGSEFIQKAGSNPFQKTHPASVVVFNTGSTFRLQFSTTPSFSGRTYANFEYNPGAGTNSPNGGAALSIDNLTVTSGTIK